MFVMLLWKQFYSFPGQNLWAMRSSYFKGTTTPASIQSYIFRDVQIFLLLLFFVKCWELWKLHYRSSLQSRHIILCGALKKIPNTVGYTTEPSRDNLSATEFPYTRIILPYIHYKYVCQYSNVHDFSAKKISSISRWDTVWRINIVIFNYKICFSSVSRF